MSTVAALWLIVPGGVFAAQAQPVGDIVLEKADVQGLTRTMEETILELLPRPLPGVYSKAELREFERRVRNLSLFDFVSVSVDDAILRVHVQEKWTLVPIVSYTSGKTAQDVSVTGGLAEHNIGGTGTQLGGLFNYSQRGPNVELWLSEHGLRPNRGAREVKVFYNVNGFRFPNSPDEWHRDRLGAELEWKGPYWYHNPLRWEIVARSYREIVSDAPQGAPPNGYYIGIALELMWDQYHWHDLMPSGYRLTFELRPGYFLGPNQNRHELRLRGLAAQPLGERTVLAVNVMAEGVNAGNPNHSVLIGSQVGVRGLQDNLYRNRAQTYANLELRHAIPLSTRVALQLVGFSDLGAFQGLDVHGRAGEWIGAANVGTGFRLIPTFLSNTMLRVDFSYLLQPSPTTFVQFGITQYFQ
jgi:hypothetical protein